MLRILITKPEQKKVIRALYNARKEAEEREKIGEENEELYLKEE